MSKSAPQLDTGVTLPDNGIIDVAWAKEALSRADIFNQAHLAKARGQVFWLLKTNLGTTAYENAVIDLDYTLETAEKYVRYIEITPVIDAISEKYYMAISLSASEYLPDTVEEALALCDIAIAKGFGLTAKGLEKAIEATGKVVKKMSDAAISVEAMKKKALHDWLLDEHGMSDDDIYLASQLKPEGLKEFTAKMAQAYFLLEDWKEFYGIIAAPIKESGNMKALRFLADLNDASASIEEYLGAERANQKLTALKSLFEREVYPEINFLKENA